MENLDKIINRAIDNRRIKVLSGKIPILFLIEPVSRCNLACRYCAAAGHDEEKLKVISKEILDDYLNKIGNFLTKYNLYGEIVMHGYEPLQAGIETFRYIQDKLKELGIRDKVRLSVQTNGVLMNDEFAEFFVKNNWNVGFSIDGPKEYHNANRIFRNGVGTYDLSIRGYNIYREKAKKNAGIISVITSAYRKPSLEESAKRYWNWLVENNIKGVNLHLASHHPSIEWVALTNKEYFEWFRNLFEIWNKSEEDINIRNFEEMIEALMIGRSKHGACYLRNGCWKVLSIDYKGTIHFCDRWSYVGKNIKDYNNIEEILFKSDISRIQASRPYILKKYDPECSKCKYFNICQGGCTNEGINNYYLYPNTFGIPQWTKSQFCEFYKLMYEYLEQKLIEKGFRPVTMNKLFMF